MNVYDFDGTIYAGDSTVDFYLYCLRKCPKIFLCAPRQASGILLRAAGRLDTGGMKERFVCFLKRLEDTDALVESFWEEPKLRGWYLERKRETDLIISASPEFLLAPVCRRLGVQPPIATRMNPANGRLLGRNCKGGEKVRRFYERFPEGKIQRFYSDSMTDAPLAALAEEAFFVRGGKPVPWKGVL